MNELASDDAAGCGDCVRAAVIQGPVEKAGGISYLAELAESTPGASNAGLRENRA